VNVSPNDQAFLEALGIKPEQIIPASQPGSGYAASFEPCPTCLGRRHRNLNTGEVFCVSCAARKQREFQAEVDRFHSNRLDLQESLPSPVFYRNFQVARIEGQGWRYCMPGDYAFEQWRKSDSLRDAMAKIDRLAPPDRQEPELEIVENACRSCGAPCGGHDWCRSCGIDKFGDGR